MMTTLRTRISIEGNSVSTRLAPGAARVLVRQGTAYAPVVYGLEQEFGVNLQIAVSRTENADPAHPEVLVDAWDAYVQLQERGGGTPIKSPLGFDRWLLSLRASSHLPSFIELAFRLDGSNASARQAMLDWVQGNPIQAQNQWLNGLQTILPDSVVVVRLPAESR